MGRNAKRGNISVLFMLSYLDDQCTPAAHLSLSDHLSRPFSSNHLSLGLSLFSLPFC
jgi:hypothetical protein